LERNEAIGLKPSSARVRPQLTTLSSGASYWDVSESAPDSELSLLAVHAHPDDEASKGAATLARYASEGVRTIVVTCTGGERGDVLNKKLDADSLVPMMAEIRAAEMERAARALGLFRHYWLGFEDSGFPEGGNGLPEGCFARVPLEEPVARLVEILRLERPQVLLTYDEFGGYPHPDHIRTHEVSMRAAKAAADPSYYPQIGTPHRVSKIYYHSSFARARLEKLHDLLVALGEESPFEKLLASRATWPEKEITTKIDCVAWLPARRQALIAHESQIDPDSFFLRIPDELLAEALPTEDYHLADTTVEVDIPEDDLFAGLR
jgi:mycothiol S-conjugate amidase